MQKNFVFQLFIGKADFYKMEIFLCCSNQLVNLRDGKEKIIVIIIDSIVKTLLHYPLPVLTCNTSSNLLKWLLQKWTKTKQK